MTIDYNVTGSERKRLADYIAGFLGSEKKYLGVPSCAYRVGYIEVSKDGAITFDDRADSVEIETLLEELEREGFHAEPAATEPQEAADAAPVKDTKTTCTAPQDESVGLTMAVPLENVAVDNLTKLLDAKGSLIKRRWALTDCRLKSARTKFPSPGSPRCRTRTKPKPTRTSSARSVRWRRTPSG